jgi:hypothetical protein
VRIARRVMCILLLATVSVCCYSCWRDYAAQRDFERLLAGDSNIALVEVEFEGHEKSVILNDSESLGYLSEMCRSAQIVAGKGVTDVPYKRGASYYINARLSTGQSIRSGVTIPDTPDQLTLEFPIDATYDPIVYLVILREPVPEALAAVLAQLR